MNALGLIAGVGMSKFKLAVIVFLAAFLLTTVLGAALYVRNLRSSVETLEKEKAELVASNSVLKDNNDVLRDNMKKLATANHTNYLTAQSLIKDKEAATKAISNLAAMRTADKAGYDRLTKKLEEMLKDPRNDGPVAPVLREVMREIQKERDKK